MAIPHALRVEIITRDFGRMLEDLAAVDPTIEFRDVVVAEALAVLTGSLSSTKAADVAKIRRRWDSREYTTFNGKKYNLSNRYPDEVWAAISQARQDDLEYRLGARGLSKQSWYFFNRLLGGEIKAPAYVARANVRGRQFPQNANRTETGTGQAYTLTILNTSPIVQAAGGERALLNAMARRARYFRRAMEHRFYLNAATRARRYPRIFVRPM